MIHLPDSYLIRMKERLGEEFPAFLQSYDRPPLKGLRVNSLKISAEEFCKIAPFPLGERVAWEKNGFYITEPKAGGDVYHFAGLYYLQEPSAMAVAAMAEGRKKIRVLDLCAAPGGKTTQIAAQMRGEGILVANEIDPIRAKILSQNVERCGIKNCAVTGTSPSALAKIFPSYFDLILVDAPCSGEGMFKKEPEALTHWSRQNVAACALRQKEILDCAAAMLAEGGMLIYSTCTFAEEEDEWQMEAFLKRNLNFQLLKMEKLYPHCCAGEGHFCAMLKKNEGGQESARRFSVRKNHDAENAFSAFCKDLFGFAIPGEITTLPDGRMFLIPSSAPDLSSLRLLRLGVEAGKWDGKTFKPSHALAMAFGSVAKRNVILTRKEAELYLRGESFSAQAENGWCVVLVERFPLGFGKCLNGIVKNHYPKGLRMIKPN